MQTLGTHLRRLLAVALLSAATACAPLIARYDAQARGNPGSAAKWYRQQVEGKTGTCDSLADQMVRAKTHV